MFPSLSLIEEEKAVDKEVEDTEMETNKFDSGSEPELDIIDNMIFVLPLEYDTVTKVIEEEGIDEELSTHKPLYHKYIKRNGMKHFDKNLINYRR